MAKQKEPFDPFWIHVFDKIGEFHDNGHPSTWKRPAIRYFIEELKDFFNALPKSYSSLLKACQDESGALRIIDVQSFERIFRGKVKSSQKSANLFSAYLEKITAEEYCRLYKIESKFRRTRSRTTKSEDIKSINQWYQKKVFILINPQGSLPYHRELTMDDFYVNLSYVDKSELSKNETLELSEKESILQKQNRRILYHNALPHSYLSDRVLNTQRRIIILGNPGSGKSTFARWICWNWSQQADKENTLIPIYYNLKVVDFSAENPLVEYLTTQVSLYDSPTFLTSNIEQIVFLLDGLDEIADTNKKAIFTELYELSEEGRYIVFSRPYGLIGQSISATATYDVLGFNESTRNEYIDKSLLYHGFFSRKDRLLKTIEGNPILKDLSYNPLMLSYIITIALNNQTSKKLETIESQYQIQNLFVNCLEVYNKTEKGITAFSTLLTKSQHLAYSMELSRLFMYTSKELLDPHARTTDDLAKIGVGSKEFITSSPLLA